MARILFGIYPAWGHAAATVALAQELTRRGHVVAYASHPSLRPQMEGAGLELIKDFQWGEIPVKVQEALRRDGNNLALLLRICKGDPTHSFLDDLDQGIGDFRRVIHAWKPDLVVNDILFHVGAIAAEVEKIPHATSCPTILPSTITPGFPPLGWGFSPRAAKNWRWRMGDWGTALFHRRANRWLNRARRHCGLAPTAHAFMRFSDYLGLAYTTEALEYERPNLPEQIHYIGPSISTQRGEDKIPFPWDWLDDRPLVLVSLGTIFNGSKKFFVKVMEASRGQPWQAVAKTSEYMNTENWRNIPENVRFVPFIPQLTLLKRARAMVSHAGVNTVIEALSEGVPLVLAPAGADQPDCAQRVVDAGAGLKINLARVTAGELRQSIQRALDEPAFRAGARRVADDFARCDGTRIGADLLERLLETKRPVLRAAGQKPTIYAATSSPS